MYRTSPSIALHNKLTIQLNNDTEGEIESTGSPETRRKQMSLANLKNCDTNCLKELLASANPENTEQLFRIKSKVHSHLILYSSNDVPDFLLPDITNRDFINYLLQTAIIESKTSAAEKFALQTLKSCKENYDLLRPILIDLSLNEFSTESLNIELLSLLKSNDRNIRYLTQLTLSNFILPLKNTAYYSKIANELLKEFKRNKTDFDTIQYLSIVGNAAIEKEFTRLKHLYNSGTCFAFYAQLR